MSGRGVVVAMFVLGVSLGTIALLFAPRARMKPALPSERPVVAVLPFENRSAEPELELIAASVGEAVLRELEASGRLDAVSTETSLMFKDVEGGIGRVAAELGADYVIAGSLDRLAAEETETSGAGAVRVDVYLYRAGADEALWADRIDWEASEARNIAAELAARIAGSLARP